MTPWGRGRLVHLTCELRSPRAIRFSEQLERSCGCRLAWHRRRQVHVVYKDRGTAQPITYLDIGRECPLQFASIPYVAKAVAWGDARRNGNWQEQLRLANSADSARQQKATAGFVDDRLPDFWRDFKRLKTLMKDGRYSSRIFDLGAKK